MSIPLTTGTVRDAIDVVAARLAQAGIDTARLDARILMAHVMERDQSWLIGHGDDPLPTAARATYEELATRRAGREPLAYLTGKREFWSLDLRVTPDTLIPRPDSETLVEAALDIISSNMPRILDLGTGSGCLLLAILSECRHAYGLGIDIDEGAVRVAEQNARNLGVSGRARFSVGNWERAKLMAKTERFDLVVSNPPYIPEGDIAGMAPDVRVFEPLGALSGGRDGLDAYRYIAARLNNLIVKDGYFIGEFGFGQGPAVEQILCAAGLQVIGFRNDIVGRQRCIIARRHD